MKICLWKCIRKKVKRQGMQQQKIFVTHIYNQHTRHSVYKEFLGRCWAYPVKMPTSHTGMPGLSTCSGSCLQLLHLQSRGGHIEFLPPTWQMWNVFLDSGFSSVGSIWRMNQQIIILFFSPSLFVPQISREKRSPKF